MFFHNSKIITQVEPESRIFARPGSLQSEEKIYFADSYEKCRFPRQNKVALQILFAIMKHNFENMIINRREKPDTALLSTGK